MALLLRPRRVTSRQQQAGVCEWYFFDDLTRTYRGLAFWNCKPDVIVEFFHRSRGPVGPYAYLLLLVFLLIFSIFKSFIYRSVGFALSVMRRKGGQGEEAERAAAAPLQWLLRRALIWKSLCPFGGLLSKKSH